MIKYPKGKDYEENEAAEGEYSALRIRRKPLCGPPLNGWNNFDEAVALFAGGIRVICKLCRLQLREEVSQAKRRGKEKEKERERGGEEGREREREREKLPFRAAPESTSYKVKSERDTSWFGTLLGLRLQIHDMNDNQPRRMIRFILDE